MRPPVPRALHAALLAIIPILALSNYFSYHAPGAIGSSLQSYFGLDEEQLASLFTMYSVPNVVLVFVGGSAVDRWGVVRVSLVLNLIVTAGMILFASAPRHSSFTLPQMLAGRFLLGVGGECIVVCGAAMLTRWFKHTSALTFAMGVNTAAVHMLGSAPAFLLLPLLLGKDGMNRHAGAGAPTSGSPDTGAGSGGDDNPGNVRLCLWVVVLVCGVSLLANLLYAALDNAYGFRYLPSPLEEDFEKEIESDMRALELVQMRAQQRGQPPPPPSQPPRADRSKDGGKYHKVESSDVTPIHVRDTNENVIEDSPQPDDEADADGDGEQGGRDANGANGQRDRGSNDHSPSNGANGSSGGGNGGGSGGEHSNLLNSSLLNLRALWAHAEGGSSDYSPLRPWRALQDFPLLFWLVLSMHCMLSPILYSFSAFGSQFLMEKYGYSQENAGFATSLLYIAFILAPCFGWLIDRIGYRSIIQTCAAALIPSLFLALHLTSFAPHPFLALLGVCFAVTESNALAMIATVTPQGLLGTGFGVVGCATSVLLLVLPYTVGWLHYHTHHYAISTLLFILLSSLGWLASFVTYVVDVNAERQLTASGARKTEDEAATGESAEQAAAYPELEIVFDADDVDAAEEDEEHIFRIEDSEEELIL